MMKDILSYILNPNKIGVYITSVSIDLSTLKQFFNEIKIYDEKRNGRSSKEFRLLNENVGLPDTYIAKLASEELAQAVDHLSIYRPESGMLA